MHIHLFTNLRFIFILCCCLPSFLLAASSCTEGHRGQLEPLVYTLILFIIYKHGDVLTVNLISLIVVLSGITAIL